MSEKILLVDDQLYMMRLIQHHLEKAGYELIQARSGVEARTAMAVEQPKLVVSNARALEADLQAALNETHLKDHLPSIPMIRVTDVPSGMEEKHDSTQIIFHKPFSPTHFVAQVKKLIPQPSSENI